MTFKLFFFPLAKLVPLLVRIPQRNGRTRRERERERLIYLKELVHAIMGLANLRCTEQVSRLDVPVS